MDVILLRLFIFDIRDGSSYTCVAGRFRFDLRCNQRLVQDGF
jgi:hypothetical protein